MKTTILLLLLSISINAFAALNSRYSFIAELISSGDCREELLQHTKEKLNQELKETNSFDLDVELFFAQKFLDQKITSKKIQALLEEEPNSKNCLDGIVLRAVLRAKDKYMDQLDKIFPKQNNLFTSSIHACQEVVQMVRLNQSKLIDDQVSICSKLMKKSIVSIKRDLCAKHKWSCNDRK